MSIDCGVCNYVDDDHPPAVLLSDKIVRARAVHVCCECRREIQKGDRFESVAGKWDGEFYVFKTCLVCVEIRGAFSCDGTYVYEALWESLTECFPDLTTGCFEKLETAAAKAYLKSRWWEWKQAQT